MQRCEDDDNIALASLHLKFGAIWMVLFVCFLCLVQSIDPFVMD